MKSSEKLSMKTFLKLLKMIGYYKIWLGVSMLLAAIAVVFQLYIPILFGDAIDEIISAGNVHFSNIYMYLIRIGVLIAIVAVSTWLMSVINNKITYRVVQDLRDKAISHIQTLPVSYLDSHSTGDIVGRVIADADQLADGLLLGFTQLFQGVVMIIVTIIYMLSVNLTISLMVIALTPVSFLVARFIASRSYKMFSKQTETRGRQTAMINEVIGNQKVVKAFGREKKSLDQFDGINERLEKSSLKAIFYSSLTNPCTRFVNNVVYAGVALSGALVCVATAGSAAVLGRNDLGSIEVGMAADVFAIRKDSSDLLCAVNDPLNLFGNVGYHKPCNLVFVNGELTVSEGKLVRLDEDSLIRISENELRRFLAKL